MNYVTVIPATKDRNGFMVSARTGSTIVQTRLEAREPEAVRAEAQRMYPDRVVWMKGDPKPW
jgi:hypothetical protein